eukprot:TRINITY_DN4635_c0_g1_i2.p1 TRINITY_DN4635_c0_g1~~TRINITY_DN4635_c0_g1_i2.p1  ORF type:complete len:817 (+),score=227.61 TRINITY_DN4635_c0_g1_i2:36-2453(+)
MGDSALPVTTYRNLGDRLYDKRKLGALEVEQLVKEFNNSNNEDAIRNVIRVLTTDFTDSPQGNNKKGGLIGLAATAIGLGADAYKYIAALVPPVLRCFSDPDSRVRYYACESLYNVSKVTRGKMLPFFNEIFDGLCKLSADPDPNVKSGAMLLDRLVKDIVTESRTFDIERFIPLLQERVYVTNPFCRQFLVSWVAVLHSVPDIDMVLYLPKFLDGMFNMLKDPNKDIRTEADTTLSEFLRELHKTPEVTGTQSSPTSDTTSSPPAASSPSEPSSPDSSLSSAIPTTPTNVDYGSMVSILVHHCSSGDDFTRVRALAWVNDFIMSGKDGVLPFSAQMLAGILPCLSHEVQEIEAAATRANVHLQRLVNSTAQVVPVGDIVQTATQQFLNQWVPTRLSALRWVLMLHDKLPQLLSAHLADLFPALLKTLSDPSDEVVRLDLEVMARLSLDSASFERLMRSLVDLFSTDPQLLHSRGSLIVRQLALYIEPENIYRKIATILESEEEPEFATTLVQTLNLILLTAVELQEVRQNLKNLESPQSRNMFCILYKSWAHSPASLFCLCLLCQVYEHASFLLTKFADMEITVNFLMEIDKLVQLLESPIFIHLRLQLLEPERYPYLFKALYGLLMLLPQSTAFDTLRGRLTCISSLGVLHLIPKAKDDKSRDSSQLSDIDFSSLGQHFAQLQKKHERYRRKVQQENDLMLSQMYMQKMTSSSSSSSSSFSGATVGLPASNGNGAGSGGSNSGSKRMITPRTQQQQQQDQPGADSPSTGQDTTNTNTTTYSQSSPHSSLGSIPTMEDIKAKQG